jgi:hypothetical protein
MRRSKHRCPKTREPGQRLQRHPALRYLYAPVRAGSTVFHPLPSIRPRSSAALFRREATPENGTQASKATTSQAQLASNATTSAQYAR